MVIWRRFVCPNTLSAFVTWPWTVTLRILVRCFLSDWFVITLSGHKKCFDITSSGHKITNDSDENDEILTKSFFSSSSTSPSRHLEWAVCHLSSVNRNPSYDQEWFSCFSDHFALWYTSWIWGEPKFEKGILVSFRTFGVAYALWYLFNRKKNGLVCFIYWYDMKGRYLFIQQEWR